LRAQKKEGINCNEKNIVHDIENDIEYSFLVLLRYDDDVGIYFQIL
jgi:hypothetical protein